MKNLLLTTMLVSAFAATSLIAQTTDPAVPGDGVMMPEITAPEGFVRQDISLTAEDLLGATIYDATGESIGDVHDLVLDIGASGGTTPEGVGGTVPDSSTDTDTMTGTGMSPDSSGGTTGAMPEGSATDGAMDGSAAPDAGTAGTAGAPSGEAATGENDGANTGTAVEGSTSTDPMMSSDGASGTGTSETTAPSDNVHTGATGDAADGAATDGTGTAPDANATGTTTPTGANDKLTPGVTAGAGEATHAVLDIGGFLGMGEHRIAVPITDLAIYRSDSETRVYLPWTREQLEALPAYDENDPTTLGRSNMPMAN